MPIRTALVLGANGQDGSYLIDALLRRGVQVHGAGRQPVARFPAPDLTYHALDLTRTDAVGALVEDLRPDAVFHVAAVHGAAGFRYEDHWLAAHQVNTLAAHAVLDVLRRRLPETRFVYASSAKAFGAHPPEQVNEATPHRSTCLYSITKNAATDVIEHYRRHHGVRASVAYLFNHESPRRGPEYFIPILVARLAEALIDRSACGPIGTLGFWCDWGSAEEYMDLMVEVAARTDATDACFATGRTVWAEALTESLFSRFGLRWQDHITETFERAPARPPYHVDITRLSQAAGRPPHRRIEDVCLDILRENHPSAWAVGGLDRAPPG